MFATDLLHNIHRPKLSTVVNCQVGCVIGDVCDTFKEN